MTSTIEFIANMQTEVDAFQNKIAELEKRKTDIESEISEFRSDIKRRNDLLMVWEGKGEVLSKEERKAQQRSRSGGGMKVILEILKTSGQPLNAREVLDALVKRKAAGSSSNPIRTIRSVLGYLKRRGQVVSAGRGLFCLPEKS